MLINKGNSFYISETTTATRNPDSKTNKYVAISDHLVSGKDFTIFLAKVNRTILCRTLTMHMKSYLPKINNMRNIRILCRNHKKLPAQTRNKIFPAGQGISFFTDYHTASLYTLWICIARYPVSVSSSLCPIHSSRFLQMSVATL